MLWQVGKILIAAAVISCTSWLAGRQPRMAGFLLALPISSMLALILFQAEYHDTKKAVLFAKSILLAVPLSILFFVPFLFAEKLGLNFWELYLSGLTLLAIGYGVHTAIF